MSVRDFARNSQTRHYHMMCGEIVYRLDGDDATPMMMRQNVMVIGTSRKIGLKEIAKAQMGLQNNMAEKMKDVSFTVLDCIILSMMYLGDFTAEEFQRAPDGTKMQLATEPDGPSGNA